MKHRYIVFSLFVILVYGVCIYFSTTRHRILVLQSYGPDYSWTQHVDQGLKHILNDQSFCTTRWHYMDTKNHPDLSFIKSAALKAKEVIKLMEPHVIIIVDDDALKYVGFDYLNDPKINLVFAGINKPLRHNDFKGATNITGILEKLPLNGLKETLGFFNISPLKIVHLSDQSTIVKMDDQSMHAYDWGKTIRLMPSHLVTTFDDWKKALQTCNKTADMILISNYRKIYDNTTLMNPKDIMTWTMKHATIPVIGLNHFVFEDGAHFSLSTSPYEQGITAATMALSILKDKKSPKDMAIKDPQQFIIGMRQKVKPFSSLPKVYENFARFSKTYL